MKVRQAELRSDSVTMVVWVNAERVTDRAKRIRGHDGKWWNVHRLYRQVLDTSRLQSEWRVGGLM